jgi:hypothetical protein
MTRIRRSAALLAATYAVASCRLVATGADGEEGDAYVLRTVAGEQVPAVAVSNGLVVVVKLADTIWLRADGTGREVKVERSRSDVSLPPGEITRRYEHSFHYRVSDGGFEVEFPCPPNASCVAPPHYRGELTAGRLRLDHALYYRTPLEFERAPR